MMPVADTPNLDQTQPLPPMAAMFFSRYRLKAELGRGWVWSKLGVSATDVD